MNTSLKIRAAAMAAALVTSFALLDWVALIGHPAGKSVPEAQVAAEKAGDRVRGEL